MKNYKPNKHEKKSNLAFFPRAVQTIVLLVLGTFSYAQVTVNTIQELLPYLNQDNVEVILSPGEYTITTDNITNGDFPDFTTINEKKAYVLLLFQGNNSVYDFAGVTINVETAVFNAYADSHDGFYEVQVTGNNNIIKNLTLTDLGSVDDYPKNGCVNVVMDGSFNRIESFTITSKGSYPYGYGDAFGKGGTYTIKHFKHSAFLIRGESNHALNNTIYHRSYGHCMFMQAANNPLIEGCYLEGEMRSTDDMLAETSGPAYDIDFYTVWGYRLPAGYMLSTGEAGIRAYNAGSTVIDGVEYLRGTSNVTVRNCTIKNLRTGVTIAHATGTKYVEGCTAIGCENGFSLAKGDVVDCYADCAYGPVYSSTYESDNNYNAEITIIPPEGEYYNGYGSVAYIGGTNHNITLKTGEGLIPPQDLTIKVGGDKNSIRLLYGNLPHQNDFEAQDFTLNNLTNFPVFLSDKSSEVVGQSGGMVTDLGTDNNVVHTAVSTGKYQAEQYSDASGINTETTTDEGFGENVTDIALGDWMEYEIDVPHSGTYVIDYRLASESVDGEFSLSIGLDNIENVSFSATGGDQVWETVRSATSVYLSEGSHTIRITANTDGWKMNWFDILLECAVVDIEPYYEVYNSLGNLIQNEASFTVTSFPGNAVSFQPEPIVGGSWSWTGPESFSSDMRIIDLENIQSADAGIYQATYTNDCGQQSIAEFNLNVVDAYLIEAEDYVSSNGITIEDTDDVGGEQNITSINDGDWVQYTINLPFAATYTFDYRLEAVSDGEFTLSIDGDDLDAFSFETQTWNTLSSSTVVYLKEGMHTIRITSQSDGWKMNWLKLVGQDFVNPCNLPFENDAISSQNQIIDWSSGVMDISCVSNVNIYVTAADYGSLSNTDQLNIFYRLDGAAPTPIAEKSGNLSEFIFIVKDIQGSTLELIVESTEGGTDSFYELSKLYVVESTDQTSRIEAEDFDDMNGVKIGSNSDDVNGQNLGSIAPGEWSMYEGLDLTGMNSMNFRLASIYDDAFIEVRLGSEEGDLIGVINAPNTGAWGTYETVSTGIIPVTGFYDVYLVYQTNESANVCNVNWFQFSETDMDTAFPNAFDVLEAEDYDEMSGIDTESTSDPEGGDMNVGWVHNNDWIMFKDLYIKEAVTLDVRYSCPISNSFMEIRAGSENGTLLANVTIENTGGWHNWATTSVNLTTVDGLNDIYFVFKGEDGYLFNVNWLKFNPVSTNSPTNTLNTDVLIYPNPTKGNFSVRGANNCRAEIYNYSGQLVLSVDIEADDQRLSMQDVSSGIYILRLLKEGDVVTNYKFIKH